MIYSEASFFDGYHFAHIAAWKDVERLAHARRILREKIRRQKRERGA